MKNSSGNGRRRRADEYAGVEEFCAIFQREMRTLYLLALTLTGSTADAEACFLGAFEDCQGARRIFKPWANSWSRLSVIHRATDALHPRAARHAEVLAESDDAGSLPAELAEVLRLDAFRRFVYVLTVLENYSIRDAAILLKHGVRDVALAQRQAIELIGRALNPVRTPAAESLPAALTA